jgi:hypothetical protein
MAAKIHYAAIALWNTQPGSDSTKLNQTLALSLCFGMLSGQTLRVCPEENRLPLFRIML